MGACCTKDPHDGPAEAKEERLDNQLAEKVGRRTIDPRAEDTTDNLEFTRNASLTKSIKPEINVLLWSCENRTTAKNDRKLLHDSDRSTTELNQQITLIEC